MCDYCEKMKSLHYNKGGVIQEVYIEADGSLTITHPVSEFDVSFKINYCPMCSRSLRRY